MAASLPGQFHTQLVNGYAIAEICQISLKQVCPKGLPCGEDCSWGMRLNVACGVGRG